ncbi:hypothetical protein J437_LFUL000921 [Ladona fulva]|uniref:Uncharacterized protein n=1 Tax=Ladona fulva TaxID=123851 RepID=A0A8K0NYS3_LADFU|nr:hypothetical protein J437_LFUL000921 [Ladona fulva]
MNDALSEEKHEMCALEKEIEKELEEIERLKEKIVSSPDTVSRTIAELSMKKKDMESDQAHLRNRAKQMMLLDSNLEQIASMIQSKLPQVDDLSANLIFLRDLENGLIEDEAAVKSAKEKFDTYAGRCQAVEMDCAHLEQEMKHFQVKSVEERTSLEESIQQALKQKAEAEHKQIEHGAQQVVLAQEICQLKEEIKDVERDEKDFIKYFNEMEDKMYDAVRIFKKLLNEEARRSLQE